MHRAVQVLQRSQALPVYQTSEQPTCVVQSLGNAGKIAFPQIGHGGSQHARIAVLPSIARAARQLPRLYVGQPSSRQRLLLEQKPQHTQMLGPIGKATTSLVMSVTQLEREGAKELLIIASKKIVGRDASRNRFAHGRENCRRGSEALGVVKADMAGNK